MPTATRTDPELLALHAALTRLVKLYQFRDKDQSTCHGITVTQCYALEAVIERAPLTVNELAAELQLNKSTASRTADSLMALGLVERAPNPASGRSVLLFATRSGKILHARIRRDLLETESAILAAYPKQAWRVTTSILEQLAAAASARIGGQ